MPEPVRDQMITIAHRLPRSDEHRRLAEAVGWHHAFDWERLPASLERSICGAVALDGDAVVGMGRVVGDGVLYFYVQDIVVLPAYQRQGIGRRIVNALIDQIAPHGPAFVGLFATPDGMPLYEQAGFSPGDMTGLFQVLPPIDREVPGENPAEHTLRTTGARWRRTR